jgi:hypothetical protein
MTLYSNFVGIIEDNFLSQNEIIDIKEKVLQYKELWKFEGDTGFFPYGLYAKEDKEYRLLVDEFRNLLETNFSSVYTKIQKKISDLFETSISFVSHKHKPGFHIFGPGPLDYKNINYHTDQFPNVLGKIYSFIIPISLPETPTGLDYIPVEKNIGISDIKRYASTEICKTLIYNNPGCLGMWDGNVIHTIKPFILNKNEYRITMQFHMAFNTIYPSKSFIFW